MVSNSNRFKKNERGCNSKMSDAIKLKMFKTNLTSIYDIGITFVLIFSYFFWIYSFAADCQLLSKSKKCVRSLVNVRSPSQHQVPESTHSWTHAVNQTSSFLFTKSSKNDDCSSGTKLNLVMFGLRKTRRYNRSNKWVITNQLYLLYLTVNKIFLHLLYVSFFLILGKPYAPFQFSSK